MNRTFVEYYRCPEEFTRCFTEGASSEHLGRLRFGPEAVRHVPTRKDRVSFPLNGERHELHLPLDPDEVVDNLRRERYRNGSGNHSFLSGTLASRLYYYVRPLLGVSIRRHLQKLRLADWRSISFPRWPVDQTVEQVHQAMLRLCLQENGNQKVPFIWFWPDGLRGCVMVTHDVETARGRDFCPAVMDVDESFGIRSSFQLIPEERYMCSPSFTESIRSRGFEINVHDLNHDGRLFADEAIFHKRVRRINFHGRALGAQGFRSGALYRNTDWYKALEFSYDMSVPNSARLDPQRGGCCTVMPYFIGRILELPVTTTQDYSLFCILNQYSMDLWKHQIAEIHRYHGLASFIIHPDYIREARAMRVYKLLLAYLADLRAKGKFWIALPKEVNQWWRARSQMKLVRSETGWTIEGPERDRAMVVYAFLDGGRVVYEQA